MRFGFPVNLCAKTNQATGQLDYGPQFASAIANNATLATLTFAHEIGHLMRLAENTIPGNPNSLNNRDIMDQSIGCPGTPNYSWDVDPNAANGQGAQPTYPPAMQDAKQIAKCQKKSAKCKAKAKG